MSNTGKTKIKHTLVAGLDEVGRGPLAGPVVAAAVILHPGRRIQGLADSKVLSESDRGALDLVIRERAIAFAIAEASVEEIDELNILHASMLAMRRACMALKPRPQRALIDGNRCPDLPLPCRAIVKGDQKIRSISAASIIAKVYRDRLMHNLHEKHPEYGFDRHKGYPTVAHRQALEAYGALPEHRRSFAPVRRALEAVSTLDPGKNKSGDRKRDGQKPEIATA